MSDNLNLGIVASFMTPKLILEPVDERDTYLSSSHKATPLVDKDGKPLNATVSIDGESHTLANVQRVAITRRADGKACHDEEHVANTLAQLETMPDSHQQWLSIASYFASKAPQSERDDWRGNLYIKLVEESPAKLELAWAIASNALMDLLRAWKRYHGFAEPFSNGAGISHDDPYVENTVGDIASSIGYLDEELDYVESRIDAKALWESLNAGKRIKGILNKRLRGQALPSRDRVYLHRWLKERQPEIMSM